MSTKLIAAYQDLINNQLPSAYTSPIRYNHCFNRVILDWLFKDCWYKHLDLNKTAISQLNEAQVQSAIERMNEWLLDKDVLTEDNRQSLLYRRKLKANAQLNR